MEEEEDINIEFVQVTFTSDDDAVAALYCEGRLYQYGSYGVHEIGSFFQGFFDGLAFADLPCTLTRYYCSNAEMNRTINEGGEPPGFFSNFKSECELYN